MEFLKRLLQTIQNETVPMPGHQDPKALDDCWRSVYDAIDDISKYHDAIIQRDAEIYAGRVLDTRKRSGAFSGYIAGSRAANERIKHSLKK